MSVRFARTQAERLARQLGEDSTPVDVERVAGRLGLPVVYADLGEGVSGLLVSDGDEAARICVQRRDPPARRRFAIAHQIGHHQLRHKLGPGRVHVDRGHFISGQGPRAAPGVDPKEIEAAQFAASLLMPTGLVREEVAALGAGPLLDHHVSRLADSFGVSEQAMTVRLSWLGLL